jgi:SEC-C motif
MAGMLVQPALPAPLRAGLFRPLALVAGAKVIGRTTVAGRPVVIVGQLTAGMLTETHARILRRVSNLIDSGWAAWLPFELIDALEARGGNSAQRRSYRQRLERGPSETDRERWERFALVCPSRIDLPDQAGLDEGAVDRVLDDLGLLDAAPEAVELVLTLDQEDVRDLERIRSARDAEGVGAVPAGMPELNVLGGGRTGRNDPCPCGSGKKFKRCHGR